MSDKVKTLIAVLVVVGATVMQAVVGFTSLGSHLSVERTTIITLGGGAALFAIVLWVAQITHAERRAAGVTAAIIATITTIGLFSLTEYLHHIVVRQRHHEKTTVTALRGALTATKAELAFGGTNTRLIGAGINTYDDIGTPPIHVEQQSDTVITLHDFQYPQHITIAHTSDALARVTAHTTNNVTLLTPAVMWQRIVVATCIGGVVCGIALVFVFWFSPPPATPRRAGFHTTATSSTQQPANQSAAPTQPPTAATPPKT